MFNLDRFNFRISVNQVACAKRQINCLYTQCESRKNAFIIILGETVFKAPQQITNLQVAEELSDTSEYLPDIYKTTSVLMSNTFLAGNFPILY